MCPCDFTRISRKHRHFFWFIDVIVTRFTAVSGKPWFQAKWESCFVAVWLVHYLSLRVNGYNSKRPTCKISSGLKPSHGFHWKGLSEVNFGSWIWSMPSFTAEWRNFSPYEIYLMVFPRRHMVFIFPFHNFHEATLLQVCCSLGFRGSTGTCAPSGALAAQTSPELLRRGSFEPRLGLRHTAIIATAPSKSYGISTVWNQWLKSEKKPNDLFGGRGVVWSCWGMQKWCTHYIYIKITYTVVWYIDYITIYRWYISPLE